jgi:hypothetical protein
LRNILNRLGPKCRSAYFKAFELRKVDTPRKLNVNLRNVSYKEAILGQSVNGGLEATVQQLNDLTSYLFLCYWMAEGGDWKSASNGNSLVAYPTSRPVLKTSRFGDGTA